MTEYLVLHRYMIRVLPEGVSTKAAALAEPLAVGLHGINLVGDLTGKAVLVSGAGPIGLLAAFAAMNRGAATVAVSDLLDGPLERARQMGATATYKVSEVPLPENAFDVVLECTGAPAAVTSVIKAARRRGVICQIGTLSGEAISLSLGALLGKELTWVGAFRFDNEIDDAVSMIAQHPDVIDVVTHVLPVEDAVEAFAIAKDSNASGKVLVSL